MKPSFNSITNPTNVEIREFRSLCKLTQKQMSEIAGVHLVTYQSWELGKHGIRPQTWELLKIKMENHLTQQLNTV